MRNSILILVAATCLASANTAFAQEVEKEKTPAQSFAGPRVEATIGLDQSGDDALSGGELTGLRAGGAVGYDVAIGKRVTIGVEGGIGWVVAGSAKVGPFPSTGSTTYKTDAARDIDVSARIGYALSPKTLIFAKAGWADLRYDTHGSDGRDYGPSTANGLRVGAGVEQKLTKNVYAKAEYRLTRTDDYRGHDDRHQLLTGIGVRF
ncbi:outer membrane immunogenic protein [Sphingomonas kyeonggiensis]|uniref:outer membrane protein n=1 Tax=Sphingomonas kyeonggiensis TaxID=1268553 RepID=UPI00278303A2|nr:porin family protein [Sphingomonas kyeonggiensis]MDQ0251422.1 outer membrane immunogenic protein [Sphingomonas kyeonggiensis]